MPLSHSDYEKLPPSAPDWIIPNLLKRQNTMLIHGMPKKACKTYLSTKLAFDIAHCRPLWGIHDHKSHPVFVAPHPMRTVHFCQEDTDDDIRIRNVDIAIKAGGDKSPGDLFWVEAKDFRYKLDTPIGVQAMRHVLDIVCAKAGPIDLVIYDPLRNVLAGDENSSQDIMAMYSAVEGIQKTYNCAGVITHHITKPPTAPNSSWDPTSAYAMRGSGAIYGSADAIVGVVPTKGNSAMPNLHNLTLYFETKRAGAQRPVMLALDTGSAQIKFNGFKTSS